MEDQFQADRSAEESPEVLEQAEEAVAKLDMLATLMYSVSMAVTLTAVLWAAVWWVEWFSPWWTLLILPIAWYFFLRRELARQDQLHQQEP